MKLDVTFTETDQHFHPNFGEVHNVSDGGFERGYDAGYAKGETAGYTKGYGEGETAGYNQGNSDGYETGYTKGNSDGYANGYENGYDSGYVKGEESAEVFVAPSGVYYKRNTVLEQVGSFYAAPGITGSMYYGASELETFTTNYPGLIGAQWALRDCGKLREAHFPKATGMWLGNTNFFGGNTALEKVSIGSIGVPVQRMDAGSFKTPPIILELYVNAETIADIPTMVTNYVPGMWNVDATVIYRNSTTGEVITE